MDRLLFNNCLDSVLTERYNQMIKLCNESYATWMSSCNGVTTVLNRKDVLLSISLNSFSPLSAWAHYENLGHDLPYWIESGVKKRVMLVSKDPFRRGRKQGDITLSSPFGMHSLDYRGNRIMTQVVGRLLQDEISVYLTDFYKLYGEQNGKPVSFSGYEQIFKDILLAEVSIYNPDEIIAVGRVAEAAITDMKKQLSVKTIKEIPHPNARIGNRVITMVKEIER